MKLQIITKSQIASAVSLVAVNLVAFWPYLSPLLDEAKTSQWFLRHPGVLSVIVAVTSILLAVGRSIIAHRSGVTTPDTDTKEGTS